MLLSVCVCVALSCWCALAFSRFQPSVFLPEGERKRQPTERAHTHQLLRVRHSVRFQILKYSSHPPISLLYSCCCSLLLLTSPPRSLVVMVTAEALSHLANTEWFTLRSADWLILTCYIARVYVCSMCSDRRVLSINTISMCFIPVLCGCNPIGSISTPLSFLLT